MSNLKKQIGNENIYKSDWGDVYDLKRWLRDEMFVGEVLNFPCGKSDLGDVRADVDPDHDPDVLADLYNIPFEENSFDTVYCDPPYSFYGGEQYYFVHPLWEIARERLIFQTNKVSVRVSKSEKSIWTLEYQNNAPNLMIFQVFDQPNKKLTEFE